MCGTHMIHPHKILVGKPEGGDKLEKLVVNGRILLTFILKECGVIC